MNVPPNVPSWQIPPSQHLSIIHTELKAAQANPPSMRRTQMVQQRIIQRTKNGEDPHYKSKTIDWPLELSKFQTTTIQYPDYYRQPFHSVPNGWLSKLAATKNRVAMQAIYTEVGKESCLGIRKRLTQFIPLHSKVIVDFGSGDGDGPAAMGRKYPKAKVLAVECSPYMIIAGRVQNQDIICEGGNVKYVHALAEHCNLPNDFADAVTICLLLHECSDAAKSNICQEAWRILKPFGKLILTDTPQQDLVEFRGFYEPHKEAWLKFQPKLFLKQHGFINIVEEEIIKGEIEVEGHGGSDNRLFTFTAEKNNSSCRCNTTTTESCRCGPTCNCNGMKSNL